MLILSRKIGETIRIGNDIIITAVRSADGKIKIGIDAPRNILILRGELDLFDGPVPSAKPPLEPERGAA